MIIGKYQAHKTASLQHFGGEGSKYFCPQDSGVSGKIIGTCGKNFYRNPKIFFGVTNAVLHLH
ncbi:MAG TPA: hypothetical protein DEB71_10875 [Chryseobacterium carnipullorum]|nr:hypothetical protein [Chryseobacterium carnipullorum]